jgi:hypothetical protein
MSNVLETIIDKLEKAKESATLDNASFGFPNDQLEIKSVHYGDDRTGRPGECFHPTEYIRNITKIHHRTWIISPLDEAINLLRLHADTLRETEKLVKTLEDMRIPELIDRARAGKYT